MKLAWLLLGLSPPALFITGFIVWWTCVVDARMNRDVPPARQR